VKRRVLWSRDALDALKLAARHIARDNPPAARRIAATVRAAGNALGERSIGRGGRVAGTYEKSVTGTPDILAYSLGPTSEGDEAVFILHVIHMARDWPAGSWPVQ
jgi:toxin ParE1/3/4